MDISEEHVAREFTGKMLRPRAGTTGLCEPAKAKCIWTSEKSRFCENLQEKCRAPRSGADFVRACAIEMHMDMLQEPFYARIYRKNAAPKMEHPDQALGLTPAVRP